MDGDDLEEVGVARSNLACAWDPGFGQESCSQGAWWLEFSVHDPTVASLSVEIADVPGSRVVDLPGRFTLWGGAVKFYGGPGNYPVQQGTPIRLSVTREAAAGGQTARSEWFEYLVESPAVACEECAPSCALGACGDDGCGGTCECAEGEVCMPDQTCSEPDGAEGSSGGQGSCDPAASCAGKVCGDDGCGGTCGACEAGHVCEGGECVVGCVAPWSPFWQQEQYAGVWWTEFKVFGGGSLPRAVSLEIVGGPTIPLVYGWNKWSASLPYVPSGTLAVLHATDATGATAQTEPFQYLVEPAPVTDPCAGTPSASPSCVPLPHGMLTISMDDSYKSQALLAGPVMAKHGIKATIYHITQQLGWGDLPYAQALAAAGHEVGDHSRSHPYLPGLAPQAIDDEMTQSEAYLTENVGSPVLSFASPLGAYDAAVIDAAKAHFTSHRTVYPGVNYMGSDVFELKADAVSNTTSASALCALFSSAAANRAWQILVFHDFTSAASTSYALQYTVADFDAAMQCAKETPGLAVVTAQEGAAAIACASP